MKTFITWACLLAAAGTMQAQNYSIAIQQARRDVDKNNAEQQRISNETGNSGGATAPAPASPAPMDPALQATMNNVAGLQGNLATFVASGDSPDPSQKISLMNNLAQAAQGTKASTASVKKVADDLMASVAGKKKLTQAQQTKLAREIHALFNSSHLSATQQQSLLNDIQKTLTDADVSLDNAVNTVTDLKEVVAETK